MHGLKVTREHAVEFVSLRLYLTLLPSRTESVVCSPAMDAVCLTEICSV